uniref:protein FAM200C-like n=1 Tax=Myxine glutinosa TaxID=7769 RepID=UPI00358EDACB
MNLSASREVLLISPNTNNGYSRATVSGIRLHRASNLYTSATLHDEPEISFLTSTQCVEQKKEVVGGLRAVRVHERDGSQHPQCMLCNVKLSNSSLAPAKLREHFKKLHGEGQYKDATLDEFKLKRVRFDASATLPTLGFVPIDKPILTTSYEVAYLIAKQGKLHTVGETLIKPAALKMANIMLGKAAENKLSLVPLSNDTIRCRIDDMSDDILAQVVAVLVASPTKFSLQLDETTDVSNLSQLILFVRYVKGDEIKEDFLFCKPLTVSQQRRGQLT